SDVFDLLPVFCFDSNKTVGNQTAQVQRNLRAIAVRHRYWPAILTCPVCLSRLSKRGEKFARCRDADRIAPNSFCELLCREMAGLPGARGCEDASEECKHNKVYQTNHLLWLCAHRSKGQGESRATLV